MSLIPKEREFPTPLALILTVEPLRVKAPVVFPAVRVDPAPEERVVLPLVVSVVNAADEAVVKPIAVPFIPVEVVLKLFEVKIASLTPESKVSPVSPIAEILPLVPFILSAPVVRVNPLLAVSNPLEVIVPPAVVEILPVVDNVPFSLMVKAGTPPDAITKEVFGNPVLVSLITNALPVP